MVESQPSVGTGRISCHLATDTARWGTPACSKDVVRYPQVREGVYAPGGLLMICLIFDIF